MNDAPASAGRRAPRRLTRVAAALALVVVFSAACGDSGTASKASAAATSSTGSASSTTVSMDTMIMIEDFAFRAPASVSPGARVEVMNLDTEAHTVTADQGADFDVTVAPGATVSFAAPTAPGSYDFHCTYHANMHGVLVVKE